MINNLINYNYNFLGSILPFKNATCAKASVNAVPAGVTTDVYTCPAGKKAFVASGYMYNGSGVQITNGKIYTKVSGNYYLTVANMQNATAATRPIRNFNTNIYLDENEGFAVNLSQISNVWFLVYEFDKTTPITIARITTFINGDNTIYTCPANKIAIPQYIAQFNFGRFINPLVCGVPSYSNEGVVSVTINFRTVPTGQSIALWPGQNNSVATGSAVFPFGNISLSPAGSILTPGDRLIINTNSNQAGQHAWAYLYEIPQ